MDQLDEIKKRLDIVEFINRYVPLQKAGQNFRAPCPFHSEKTPSFIVSPDRQIWHCFGACNEGGDIFKFLMKWENLTFGEALRILADQAGVKLQQNQFVDQQWNQKQRLTAINQYAADFYQYLLEKHSLGEKARHYLKNRKVNLKTAKHFYLGYAPRSWDSLIKYLRKKGYSNQEVLDTGLIVKNTQGKIYDRFRSRLMFPLTDLRGNILGFSGRVMDQVTKGGTEMKYVNTPETAIYHKRENLFGLFQAKSTIRDKNEIMLVEGEFDAILAHQNGYKQTVAIKGSALTQDHLRVVKRLTNRLTFALDMDKAGHEAINRSIREAEKHEFEMQVITLKSGKDPAEVLTTAPEEFVQAYRQKQAVYSYLLNYYSQNQDLNSVYGQKSVIEAMLPVLNNIFNPILFDHYLKLLAQKTKTEPNTILKALHRLRYKNKAKTVFEISPTPNAKKNPSETLENYLLALLIQTKHQEQLFKEIDKNLNESDFYSPAAFHLLGLSHDAWKKNQSDWLKQLNLTLPKELVDSLNRGYLFQLPDNQVDWDKEIQKTVLKIKKLSLKKQIQKIMRSDNEEALKPLLKKLSKVEKSLSII